MKAIGTRESVRHLNKKFVTSVISIQTLESREEMMFDGLLPVVTVNMTQTMKSIESVPVFVCREIVLLL